jgi:hypothetical protein
VVIEGWTRTRWSLLTFKPIKACEELLYQPAGLLAIVELPMAIRTNRNGIRDSVGSALSELSDVVHFKIRHAIKSQEWRLL